MRGILDDDEAPGARPLSDSWHEFRDSSRPMSIWDDEDQDLIPADSVGLQPGTGSDSRRGLWVLGSLAALVLVLLGAWHLRGTTGEPETAIHEAQPSAPPSIAVDERSEPLGDDAPAEQPQTEIRDEQAELIDPSTSSVDVDPLPTLALPELDWDPVQTLVDLADVGLSELVSAPYDRDAFGQSWFDYDRNGCDTRNDILRRDLEDLVVKDGTNDCVAYSGVLTDPYTGETFDFLRGSGNAGELHVDHIVSLSDAWRSGAHAWTLDRRMEFANDPENLVVTFGTVNMSKGDADSSGWLPPREEAHCGFAIQVISVKAGYGLTITDAERTALLEGLLSCTEASSLLFVMNSAPN